jgi:hypothetical protein
MHFREGNTPSLSAFLPEGFTVNNRKPTADSLAYLIVQ